MAVCLSLDTPAHSSMQAIPPAYAMLLNCLLKSELRRMLRNSQLDIILCEVISATQKVHAQSSPSCFFGRLLAETLFSALLSKFLSRPTHSSLPVTLIFFYTPSKTISMLTDPL